MGSVSAEVQVLTAEVRVLMVGKRQVTLSVFRQLDHCTRGDCEPFGRVRDTVRGGESGVHVVGRAPDGTLVRSQTPRPTLVVNYSAEDSVLELIRQDKRFHSHRSSGTAGEGYVQIESGPEMRIYGQRHHYGYEYIRSEADFITACQYESDMYSDDVRFWTAWKNLPLIVLAGLK